MAVRACPLRGLYTAGGGEPPAGLRARALTIRGFALSTRLGGPLRLPAGGQGGSPPPAV
ncbi:hypothetical protein PSMK_03150 [Phycisphaera mikurensis NBRC 102666]|uniref:Uncharacterized protein n=1 Tax=Phycisphaera mikurensis (strain NBRC 102666 / KCTC 22515 / FYK2301M01) TaxID=1142394 RepID=I0IB36_PHYMF|nr:hypothetical protein PSMK_03150 [Phycisphaera mikurensis NBRC 102666]